MKNAKTVASAAVVAAFSVAVLAALAKSEGAKEVASQNSEANVVTNDNGSVSRTFTERTVATNGNLVTEHRRETRTTMDADGNILETSTSEYAQSYPVGQASLRFDPADGSEAKTGDAPAADSFLSLKFGEEFKGTNFVADADEPTLLRASFKPAKPLALFDDYFVYVTPKTHRVVKVFACAREAVEPGTSGRRHYLLEALEKRYGTWARPRSWCRPIYSFDLGGGRYATAVLAGATSSYETVIGAWDDQLLTVAADETAAIREAARKTAAERRAARVKAAADAF